MSDRLCNICNKKITGKYINIYTINYNADVFDYKIYNEKSNPISNIEVEVDLYICSDCVFDAMETNCDIRCEN